MESSVLNYFFGDVKVLENELEKSNGTQSSFSFYENPSCYYNTSSIRSYMNNNTKKEKYTNAQYECAGIFQNITAISEKGFDPFTSTSRSENYPYVDTRNIGSSFKRINYCPATIHLLIKNLENTSYSCRMCNETTSSYYSFRLNAYPNAITPIPLIENSTLSRIFNSHNSRLMRHRNSSIICKFCQKNGEVPLIYQSHELKNFEGKVICPILRKHKCEMCNATGDYAHTRKYCPKYVQVDEYERPFFRRLANGAISTCHDHK